VALIVDCNTIWSDLQAGQSTCGRAYCRENLPLSGQAAYNCPEARLTGFTTQGGHAEYIAVIQTRFTAFNLDRDAYARVENMQIYHSTTEIEALKAAGFIEQKRTTPIV